MRVAAQCQVPTEQLTAPTFDYNPTVLILVLLLGLGFVALVFAANQVRKTPSWPRSWANFSHF
jgi:hypothetical protein